VFFDRAGDIAEIPSAPLRYGLPGRVFVDFTRPADSLAAAIAVGGDS
jgi:hypothetical protein